MTLQMTGLQISFRRSYGKMQLTQVMYKMKQQKQDKIKQK